MPLLWTLLGNLRKEIDKHNIINSYSSSTSSFFFFFSLTFLKNSILKALGRTEQGRHLCLDFKELQGLKVGIDIWIVLCQLRRASLYCVAWVQHCVLLAVPLESCALGPSLCSVFSVYSPLKASLPGRRKVWSRLTDWSGHRTSPEPVTEAGRWVIGSCLVKVSIFFRTPWMKREGGGNQAWLTEWIMTRASSALLILHPFLWGI